VTALQAYGELAEANDAADEITERLAREFVAQAKGETVFMETLGIPVTLGRHLAINALRRAAMKLEATTCNG
jgi:hypothetical protein